MTQTPHRPLIGVAFMLAAMAILAITTHLTAATRILHVWRASRDAGVVAVPNVATTPAPRADAR